MNIQTANLGQTNFKSAYPVVHWVAESNGSFAPVANLKLVKRLQGKLIRVANKALADTKRPFKPQEEKIRTYLSECDVDYRNVPHVRSFYNRVEGNFSQYTPIAYMISGRHVGVFEDYLAKNIGKAKSSAKKILNNPYSQEAIQAIELYNNKGMDFVKKDSLQIKDKEGIAYILHTKFEIVRNTIGKIKDYKLLDVRFLPSTKFSK